MQDDSNKLTAEEALAEIKSVANDDDVEPLTPDQRAELNRCLAEVMALPGTRSAFIRTPEGVRIVDTNDR